jgi:teichuronic acid biosynthesis glycosyltransferase TuaC
MADALVRAGTEVTVVSPTPWVPPGFGRLSAKWRRYQQVPTSYLLDGVRVFRPRYLALPHGVSRSDPALTQLLAVRGIGLRRPSVVHTHYAYQADLGLRLARSWGVPAVLTLHGSDVNTYPNDNARTRRRFIRAVREADLVLAVSRALAGKTLEIAGVEPQTHPIGIDLRTYGGLPSQAVARETLRLPPRDFLVLFVGNLLEGKGILELAAALRHWQGQPVTGVFVGDGPLRAEVAGIPGAIVVGRRPNTEIPVYLRAADVLALPSHGEGMPTVVVEAGAAGTPVVASAVGGIPELLGDGRGLLVDPKSVDQLSTAIADVRANHAASLRRATALQVFVRELYDVDRNARGLVQWYARLQRELTHQSPRKPTGPE